MSSTYEERMALRNQVRMAQAQEAFDNLTPIECREDWEVDAEGDDMADEIIRRASMSVLSINDPRDRLARQVGILQGEIRRVCGLLAWAKEGA